MIAGAILGSMGGGVITYTLSPASDGMLFDCVFVYPAPNLFFALLDALYISRRIQAELAQAVRQLMARLEAASTTQQADK